MARLSAILFFILSLAIGCGGGGSALGHVSGKLADPYGALITRSDALVSLDGAGVSGSPDSFGSFKLSAPPGTYNLVGIFHDPSAGIKLIGKRQVTLVAKQTLDVGIFELSNNNLLEGWARYNQRKYFQAEKFFLDYLDNAKTAQANIGSSSAYSGLGWTRGQGMNNPSEAVEDFNKAVNGWSDNTDSWAGLAGCHLSRMKTDGRFYFPEAISAISNAIDIPGDYSSAPTHDKITETDLKAFRVLVNFLAGNTQTARNEALAIEAEVKSLGNPAS
ncbi:MAG TPA: hypothetical protein ENN67_06160, partial [Firmicutes bacterium]|nr:hypothetical protein [Bacillota bacterium]